MNNTAQRFVHIGFNNMQCANRILIIFSPSSACARRMVKAAKDANRFFDLTSGRTTKSLILLEDGKLIGCALTTKTLTQRIHSSGADENNEGSTDNEDHSPVSEVADSH